LFAEAEANNLDIEERWHRWHTCSLCEQNYHGVVEHALGWACWKTYLGRPERDTARQYAMNVLGNGLGTAGHHEEALSVKEAELAMKRRLGADEDRILGVQANLAMSYAALGDREKALSMERDVYSGRLKLNGEEDSDTLLAANNYAYGLVRLRRFEEAKSLLRKTVPVARRVLGEGDSTTLRMRKCYAAWLVMNNGATLGDLREAVTTLEDSERIARRVLGGAHPLTENIEGCLRKTRARLAAALRALRARETGGAGEPVSTAK
jgi:tetratricopeptide (TPR) repeat protein